MNKRKNKCLNVKMDCFVKTSAEKEAIYEIYRSCRLCGGGAGYKMPIIQNVVNITTDDVELKDKIRECVQIEVSQDDKMPPLICELCVDKISDFYDFLEMCRRTNKRTRLRLGLPPQALVRDAPDAGDCILGITEPVYVKKETNTSNTKKKGKVIKGKDVKVKKKPVVPVKQEMPKSLSRELRELLISSKSDKIKKAEAMSRYNTKPEKIQEKVPEEKLKGLSRELRELLNSSKSDKIKKAEAMSRRNTKTEEIQERVQKTKPAPEPEPKSILKRRDDSSSSNTLKRTREKEVQKRSDVQPKKVKIVETRATRTSCHDIVDDDDDDDDEDDEIMNNKVPCKICKKKYQIGVSLNNHMRTHKVPEKIIHKCNKCKKTFATSRELDRHKCVTESKRTSNVKETEVKETTVECKYCNKPFKSMASIHGHIARCKKRTSTTSSTTVIQPSVRKRLKPLQVRTVRCDPLLVERDNGHFDVSRVVCPYGLDKNCVYPYQNTQRSSLLSEDKMVVIRDDITNSFELEEYVHWDSDSGTDESDIYIEKRRKVDSLSSIALKTIFSEKFLGKVPKKKRKVKMENAFDSILNTSEVDNDFRLDIDSIIHNLGDDKSERDSVSIKILNVFSQKETDYDSDRTSFNDEFDTVQSNTSNLKSSLSFNKDVNDETSTNSIDSIAETSILQNLKGDELKTLLDTDTTLKLEEKVKNDNVENVNVSNESKDKTQNESSNTDVNGENDTSVNLNQTENQSEESNHNSEDADLRLDTEENSAQMNDFVSKNNEEIIKNDVSNYDTAKTSIDENLKESDINSHEDTIKQKEESRKDESNTENAENTSKNVIVTKDLSKNAKSIDSTSINDIVNSVEALSVNSDENNSENTNLEGSKSNSGTNTSDKSVEDAVNDIKCVEISNTVKECSDIINSAENFNNTCNYEENTSVKENVVENNSEISNDSKNNSDNINSADNVSQEDSKTEDISENAIGDTNIDKMNINNTENISANTNQTAETNKIASTDGNFDKIDHVETNNTKSTANSDKIDANNTQEISQNTENIHEFDKNGDVDSDNFNMDDLEDVSDTDIDDNKLMDDINDQLNQNNDLNNPLNQNNDLNNLLNQNNDLNNLLNQNNDLNDQLNQDNDGNDKITLDDLLTKGQNDLDSISDGEFTLDE
ncbi:putative uncharacterized protein DDB_G0282133 isoform X2 [Colias croceus]|uniref:putative uncharacterized protein DDB_G0282133 isoform X2 n=1 Tax=Colias crocea TaxID=72248 RepID=UPI001E279F80|nr:putative uncharacterized protein DDB_G0282133 isoform X2 [Colias croceus]